MVGAGVKLCPNSNESDGKKRESQRGRRLSLTGETTLANTTYVV
jgi:hypothetical protein